jgi:hypothetical protein
MGILLAVTPVEDWTGPDFPDEGICEWFPAFWLV